MEDLITVTPNPAQPTDVDDNFDFFNPPNLQACIAVDSFLVTGLQRRLVQLLTYNEEQLAQAMGHIVAIEKLLCLA